ncbi:dipeptidase [Planctomycetales bacterium ZRK34]|nr:dipeptidase [Planctomycetales bacterium ZRK34]
MIDNILTAIESDHDAAVERLCDYLRIASISTAPVYAAECEAAAEWTAQQLRACGLQVNVHPTEGHPVVVGRYDGAGADQPRVLFYGHYDVQPPDPMDKWTTPPFDPTIRDGKLYARGSSDDKGQVMCFIEALRAWHSVAGTPPVNVTVLIEGEEECGSNHLPPFIEANKDLLAADIAVVSDTAMWDAGQPAITYGLRGLLYFDIQLHGPSRDLHSGVYGGTIANPATELMLVLGQLFDADHHVTIPGFYDEVVTLTDAERAEWDTLGFDEQAWAKSIGMNAVHGEQGFTTLERRWARPSCDVNGLYGGYMEHGAKTVIPTFAGAKVSFRLAADQNPAAIAKAFEQWLHDRTPPGCTWRITDHGQARPVIVPRDSQWIAAAREAVTRGCGKAPFLVREGATIPVVADFKSLLGLDTLLIGFGLHDDNLHSPNEKFNLENFLAGCRTHAALLGQLAK